jgi:hypothetical protein
LAASAEVLPEAQTLSPPSLEVLAEQEVLVALAVF